MSSRLPRVVAATLLLLGLMFAQTGCPPDAQKHQDNLRLISDAQDSYEKKEYSRTIETASAILKDTPNGPDAAHALYLRGAAEAVSEQRAKAYVDLRAAATMSTEGETRWKAYALLGVLYFEDEDWNSTVEAMNSAAAADPSNPQMDLQLFRQGQALERLGRWSDAQAAFTKIVYTLPKGNFTDAALRRTQEIPTSFAVRTGLFDEQRNADKLVADLRTKGFKARVQPEQRGATKKYVVLVGQFATYREMKAEKARVKNAGFDALEWP